MIKMELPGRRKSRNPQKRFVTAVKDDMLWVGVAEEDFSLLFNRTTLSPPVGPEG